MLLRALFPAQQQTQLFLECLTRASLKPLLKRCVTNLKILKVCYNKLTNLTFMEKQFEKLTSVETLQERVQKKPIMELKRNPDPDEDEGEYLEIDVGVTLSELFNFLDKKQNSVIKRDKRLAEDFEDKLSDSLFGLHDRSEDYDSGYGSERFSPRPDDMPGLEAHERAFMEADSEDMAVEDDLMEIREKLSFLKHKRPE